MAISRDNSKLVTGSNDFTAVIWDFTTYQPIIVLRGHTQEVNAVAISSDNTRVITGSADTTVIVWDFQNGT